jgi:hypothetical protein
MLPAKPGDLGRHLDFVRALDIFARMWASSSEWSKHHVGTQHSRSENQGMKQVPQAANG